MSLVSEPLSARSPRSRKRLHVAIPMQAQGSHRQAAAAAAAAPATSEPSSATAATSSPQRHALHAADSRPQTGQSRTRREWSTTLAIQQPLPHLEALAAASGVGWSPVPPAAAVSLEHTPLPLQRASTFQLMRSLTLQQQQRRAGSLSAHPTPRLQAMLRAADGADFVDPEEHVLSLDPPQFAGKIASITPSPSPRKHSQQQRRIMMHAQVEEPPDERGESEEECSGTGSGGAGSEPSWFVKLMCCFGCGRAPSERRSPPSLVRNLRASGLLGDSQHPDDMMLPVATPSAARSRSRAGSKASGGVRVGPESSTEVPGGGAGGGMRRGTMTSGASHLSTPTLSHLRRVPSTTQHSQHQTAVALVQMGVPISTLPVTATHAMPVSASPFSSSSPAAPLVDESPLLLAMSAAKLERQRSAARMHQEAHMIIETPVELIATSSTTLAASTTSTHTTDRHVSPHSDSGAAIVASSDPLALPITLPAPVASPASDPTSVPINSVERAHRVSTVREHASPTPEPEHLMHRTCTISPDSFIRLRTITGAQGGGGGGGGGSDAQSPRHQRHGSEHMSPSMQQVQQQWMAVQQQRMGIAMTQSNKARRLSIGGISPHLSASQTAAGTGTVSPLLQSHYSHFSPPAASSSSPSCFLMDTPFLTAPPTGAAIHRLPPRSPQSPQHLTSHAIHAWTGAAMPATPAREMLMEPEPTDLNQGIPSLRMGESGIGAHVDDTPSQPHHSLPADAVVRFERHDVLLRPLPTARCGAMRGSAVDSPADDHALAPGLICPDDSSVGGSGGTYEDLSIDHDPSPRHAYAQPSVMPAAGDAMMTAPALTRHHVDLTVLLNDSELAGASSSPSSPCVSDQAHSTSARNSGTSVLVGVSQMLKFRHGMRGTPVSPHHVAGPSMSISSVMDSVAFSHTARTISMHSSANVVSGQAH